MDHVNCRCEAPLPSVAGRPVELGKPREWPYPVGIPQGLLSNEALRRNTQRDAYEQTLHAQGLTSNRCTCSDCCCWRVEQRRAGDDVSLCHCKECEGGYVSRHEIGKRPEKSKSPVFDWKPLVSKADQEFARYASEVTEQIVRAYAMTPAELGITEQPKDTPRTFPYPIGVPPEMTKPMQDKPTICVNQCMISVNHVPREVVSQIMALDVSINEHRQLLRKAEEYFGCQRYDAHFASIVHHWGQGHITSDEVVRHLIRVGQNMPEKDFEDTKPFDDVRAWLSAGIISPNEARRYLGLPEPEKRYAYAPPGTEILASNTNRENVCIYNDSDTTLFFDGCTIKAISETRKRTEEPGALTQADLGRVIDGIMHMADCEPREASSNSFEGLRDILGGMNTKENPNMSPISSNPVAGLADRARELAKDGKENLDAVKSAIEQGKIEYKARVEKALTGAADLEVLSGPRGKQFFVKHFYENKEYTTYGTAYPGYNVTDKEDEEKLDAYTVRLQDSGDPVLWGKYKTMQRLREALQNNEIPYVIKFYE